MHATCIYRTGSVFGGTFRLEIFKRFVIRASLSARKRATRTQNTQVFCGFAQGTWPNLETLVLSSQKVPAGLEPVL